VSSDAPTQPAPRARAVAGAPVDALLGRADELARRWAIALILARPLERIGEFPLEVFARQAPLLCAHVVRALQSDVELERIVPGANGGREPSPARRLAEVTGARDGKAAVEAVDALRGVLWEALLDELRWHGFDQSPAREVADLADRLSYVCSSALVSSLAQPAPDGTQAVVVQAAQAAEVQPARVGARVAQVRGQAVEVPAESDLPSADRDPVAGRSQRSPLGNGVVIVDEGQGPPRRWSHARGHRARAGDAAEAQPASAVPSSARAGARRTRARALPWDTPLRDDPTRPLDAPE
jgi:hypothetical protein